MARWSHHATYILMDVTYRIAAAASDDMAEARALSGLLSDLERLYPEAAAELEGAYGEKSEDNQ